MGLESTAGSLRTPAKVSEKTGGSEIDAPEMRLINYGSPPINMGLFELEVGEMLLYLYCPVKLPSGALSIPRRLKRFDSLVAAVRRDTFPEWDRKYVYLTAKTMYVDEHSPGNRPGWHADGYGSNGDLNYIWCDMNPTDFAIQKFHNIPTDDSESMREISRQIKPFNIFRYPLRNLLRLDESVVHRVGPAGHPGIRTFVKITVSDHQFRSIGNTINYQLNYKWKRTIRNISERHLDHG